MIDSLDQVTLANALELVYGSLAAAVSLGVVLGLAVVWITVAARGGDIS